jgi:hypothetical protein
MPIYEPPHKVTVLLPQPRAWGVGEIGAPPAELTPEPVVTATAYAPWAPGEDDTAYRETGRPDAVLAIETSAGQRCWIRPDQIRAILDFWKLHGVEP